MDLTKPKLISSYCPFNGTIIKCVIAIVLNLSCIMSGKSKYNGELESLSIIKSGVQLARKQSIYFKL